MQEIILEKTRRRRIGFPMRRETTTKRRYPYDGWLEDIILEWGFGDRRRKGKRTTIIQL